MAVLGNTLCRLMKSSFNSAQSKIAAVPFWLQNRNKHHQLPYFGAKNNWPKWTMMKDQRKRMTLKEYGPYKLRLNAIRKNNILPPELQEVADHEIATVPKDAALYRIVRRCAITSRPRGTVFRWRLSRIIFKHLADYNKLSGVQRARW